MKAVIHQSFGHIFGLDAQVVAKMTQVDNALVSHAPVCPGVQHRIVGLEPLGDEDADGVANDDDACPATVLPESVPTVRLETNRFADTDGDGIFDTTTSRGRGPDKAFDLGDTAGCSCEQIIEAQGLGEGHTKFGCSISAMEEWVFGVTP